MLRGGRGRVKLCFCRLGRHRSRGSYFSAPMPAPAFPCIRRPVRRAYATKQAWPLPVPQRRNPGRAALCIHQFDQAPGRNHSDGYARCLPRELSIGLAAACFRHHRWNRRRQPCLARARGTVVVSSVNIRGTTKLIGIIGDQSPRPSRRRRSILFLRHAGRI